MTMIWVGVGLGGPISGILSNLLQKTLLPTTIYSLIGFMSSALLVSNLILSQHLLYLALFLVGMSSSSQILMFGFINDKLPFQNTS